MYFDIAIIVLFSVICLKHLDKKYIQGGPMKITHCILALLLTISGINCGDGGNSNTPGGTVIDHNCVDLSLIPDYWINEAKKLTIHFAHTSHGSQILSGLLALEQIDAKYSVAILENGTSAELPPQENPAALRIYDGNPPETYIEPQDYWASQDGIERTEAVLSTGLFSVTTWTWCGQQSSNTIEVVQEYLDTLSDIEERYPNVKVIYMTGHTDGGTDTLSRNNKMVTDFCRQNHRWCFDFADIESYDPSGAYYPDTTDACDWCADWCSNHPSDCSVLPTDCAHSHEFNCLLKARAFWWLLARMAGWPGPGE